MHTEEGPHTAVGTRPLLRNQADSDRAQAWAAVALDHAAGQVELGHLRDQLKRELSGLPPAAGMRRHLASAEVPQAIPGGDLLAGEQLVKTVEIDSITGFGGSWHPALLGHGHGLGRSATQIDNAGQNAPNAMSAGVGRSNPSSSRPLSVSPCS